MIIALQDRLGVGRSESQARLKCSAFFSRLILSQLRTSVLQNKVTSPFHKELYTSRASVGRLEDDGLMVLSKLNS
jgi:hypothetical protein